ncbi:MAG: SDR family oxidoreductase [Candidatus Dadabacteria bacterium]|nr:MAG: SDR family oxidoreductase [Candidatus Dadabacteria bacterium]
MARILIAGCGYVGTRLAQLAAEAGHSVLALRRKVERLPDGLPAVRADLRRPADLRDLGGPFDFVFFTAAADGPSPEEYRAVYLRGLANLLDALGKQRPKPQRLFYTSSTAVYGQTTGEWVNESSPTEPRSAQGQILVESERLVAAAPCPATVVRLSGIYGTERRSLLERVQRGAARVHPAPCYSNRIHREDAARLLLHLMDHPDPEPCYIGSDDRPATWREVIEWLAQRLGSAPPAEDPTIPLPPTNKRCSNERLRATGYRLLYPSYREGYEAILRELSGQNATA